jgi:hypothetical protein
MKKIFHTHFTGITLLVVVFVGSFCISWGYFCGIKNTAFKVGESITFRGYYHWGAMNIGAGEATFTTQFEKLNNKNVYHVIGEGKTYKKYDYFFKVRDKYESYIDTNTMLPLKFVRNVSEGGYKIFNNVSFNHAAGNAVSTNGLFKIPDCTQDVLSSVYYARNLNFSNLKIGDKIPFTMFIDDISYNLYIKYMGKERIKIGIGTFNAIKFKPLLVAGTMFKGGEQMTCWITDDANRIPLRIESAIAVGDIRADAIKITNFRYPLTSLIKKN